MRFETECLITDHPDVPDGVPLVSSFHDYRNALSYYYPRLRSVANTPLTQFFKFEFCDNGPPDVDDRGIALWMRDNDLQQAFIRSDFSSAKYHGNRGSQIVAPEQDVILAEVGELISQHVMQERLLGRWLVVREWIDLDYCPSSKLSHSHHNEIRYFIRDGSVLYHTPSKMEFYESQMECDLTYEYVMDDVTSSSIDLPHDQAEVVASVFDDLAWSVDFARDAKSGEWYAIDMGLDGLYWHVDSRNAESTIVGDSTDSPTHDENGEWVSISGHGSDFMQYSPEQYADEMPEPEVVYGE